MEEPPTDPQTRLAVDTAPVVDREQPKRGRKKKSLESNGAILRLEARLGRGADMFRSNMDEADYIHITHGQLVLLSLSVICRLTNHYHSIDPDDVFRRYPEGSGHDVLHNSYRLIPPISPIFLAQAQRDTPR